MKILRIAITGPESTGKSTLAKDLAEYFETEWVQEYARTFLEDIQREYTWEDYITIVYGQILAEERLLATKPKILIFDTDMLVLKIWGLRRFGRYPSIIDGGLEKPAYDFHFLCGTEIAWEPDPLREHPDSRDNLYEQYLSELKALQLPFMELKGDRQTRLKMAIERIYELLA